MQIFKNFTMKIQAFKQNAATKRANKKPNPRLEKLISFMNQYSLFFHGVLSCLLCFTIECFSRRSVASAFSFVGGHTMAYFYNSLIIFASLSLVYLVKRRALFRVLISGFWLFLGTVNGCILAKRVTPFSYTDLKCLSDLFAMQNTNYFTATEAITVVSIVALFLVFCIWLWVRGPKFKGKTHRVLNPVFVASLLLAVPIATKAAQSSNIVASYFSNIAQGYENYGFVYGFSSSVVGRGMTKPDNYDETTISELTASNAAETTLNEEDKPNIIVVLLESFIDPTEVNFLQMSEDPIPNFRNLYENYSSGYLTVPVVGAGTANTEFEVLTGMNMQYFGTGEYPYKTILKQTDCESIASDLSSIGYGTHVVHNNGGNFYSRANAFSMMGFDTFTSKELMNIQEYTPLGDWPTDHILINETKKSLDSTPNQSDLVYTITVQGHGDYPSEKIIENPEITVTGATTEEQNNQWEYYVNEIHEVDKFINDLTTMLAHRNEKTVVVMFGDHLPTMGLEDSDMKSGDIFKTKYITWNNFGMEKKDADITSYQLLANITDQIGIHEGTMFSYTQNQLNQGLTDTDAYLTGLENLQYDILYGDRYCYNGEDPYPATDLVMGIDDVTIDRTWVNSSGEICIAGTHFTPWSRVFVNGEKVKTTFLASTLLRIPGDVIKDGDTIVVNQMGSNSTVFRSSNELTFFDPNLEDTEESAMTKSESETSLNNTSDAITAPENDEITDFNAAAHNVDALNDNNADEQNTDAEDTND
ncbi:MAG: LTA synthase family protein [Lachnospiraceae bacterium]|nr:LTA synthase family protein [Lachnospiraceae bacterium]